MKKIFLLAVTGCMTLAVSAQLPFFKLDLILSATPPAQLTEWGNRREVLRLIVTGQPGQVGGDVKIKTEIKLLDGTVVGTTDLVRASTYNIATATAIFTAVDVMPMDKMIFTGNHKNSLLRTGKLPSDNYTICVQLVRPVDFTPASEQKCKGFYLASTQLPILMMPYNEQVLDAKIAQTAITFRWTPLSPRTATLVTYRLQIFEVLENQNPVQALRSNMPLLDQEVKATTQYIWRPQLSFIWQQPGDLDGDGTFDKTIKPKKPEAGKDSSTDPGVKREKWNTELYVEGGKVKPKETGNNDSTVTPKPDMEPDTNNGKIKKRSQSFVWTVQTLDDKGLPVAQTDGSGEGRSEPILFYVDPNKNKPANNATKKKGHIKVIKDTTGGAGE